MITLGLIFFLKILNGSYSFSLNSSNEFYFFKDLPYEIQNCIIKEHLDLETISSLSVTCQFYHQLTNELINKEIHQLKNYFKNPINPTPLLSHLKTPSDQIFNLKIKNPLKKKLFNNIKKNDLEIFKNILEKEENIKSNQAYLASIIANNVTNLIIIQNEKLRDRFNLQREIFLEFFHFDYSYFEWNDVWFCTLKTTTSICNALPIAEQAINNNCPNKVKDILTPIDMLESSLSYLKNPNSKISYRSTHYFFELFLLIWILEENKNYFEKAFFSVLENLKESNFELPIEEIKKLFLNDLNQYTQSNNECALKLKSYLDESEEIVLKQVYLKNKNLYEKN